MIAKSPANSLAAALAAALLLAILWAFAPILDNGFVWDDGANLIAARDHWDAGLRGSAWAFRTSVAGHYQPLTFLSYQVDALLSGATPRGVHATQLFLHLLVTLAVAALAAELARTPRLEPVEALHGPLFPLLAAALFALAPIRVESVAWATERRDLLGALFTIASVWLYLRGQKQREPRLFGVAILAALAALSRAQMVLPLVLLLLDGWPLGRLAAAPSPGWRAGVGLVREKALLFAIAAASAAAAMWAQAQSGALTALAEHGLPERLVQAFYGLAFYPPAALLPAGLAGPFLPLYQRPLPFPFLAPHLLLPALASLTALVAIGLGRRRAPAVAVASGAYLLLVLPVLGLAQSGIQLVADRYAYLATLPLVLLVAAGLAKLFAAARRQPLQLSLLTAAVLALLLANTFATRAQTRVWHDDLSLWRHVLAHSESSLADNNLGQLLGGRGEAGPALFHLTRCLERSPDYPRPWNGLAALLEAPAPADAPPPAWVAATLARALTHQPGLPTARYASALAWLRAGDTTRAELELKRLLALDPDHDGARLALARLEARRHQP